LNSKACAYSIRSMFICTRKNFSIYGIARDTGIERTVIVDGVVLLPVVKQGVGFFKAVNGPSAARSQKENGRLREYLNLEPTHAARLAGRATPPLYPSLLPSTSYGSLGQTYIIAKLPGRPRISDVFGREILEFYEDVANFYSPDVCFQDARKYISGLSERRAPCSGS
jgi:hypothetical protein